MKTKTLLAFLCLLLAVRHGFGQFCPPNLDFETGTFDNWQCSLGSTTSQNMKNNILLTPSAPTTGRHEIISGTASEKDMYGGFPQLCPYGGKYSVKLGNNRPEAEAEGMSYTFQVPANVDTFSFTYFYAVVFENPSHSSIEQPRFFVTAYDAENGELINCASYDYVATGGIPGFKVSAVNSLVLYKEWSPVSIQFAGLANRTVRLEFKTADCTQGGHFGYAYIDVGSNCSNVLATAPYCIESNSIILNAPYGFKSYTWYNEDYSAVVGDQQSLTLNPPPATSGTFHVDIVPYPGYGCRDTAHAVVSPLPIPDTPVAPSVYNYCQFQQASPLTATAEPGSDLLWYANATGGLPATTAPTPLTAKTGVFTFYVTQKVLFGCESFRKKIVVHVSPTPAASFSTDFKPQCERGNKYDFVSSSTNLDKSTYTWDFGDGMPVTTADSLISHSFTQYGTFRVVLTVHNLVACSTQQARAVTVLANPVANFTNPPLICEKQAPVTLQDHSTVAGQLGNINKWWWSIEGRQNTGPAPAVTAEMPGSIPVKMAVSSVQGCLSDTISRQVIVHYRPDAAFKYGDLLCDNEMIRFNSLASLPAAVATEFVAKWYWQFGSDDSQLRDPGVRLAAGQQKVTLVVESNYGCKSLPADSNIIVFPKPQIALKIDDSCVFRTINYQAVDLMNTVSGWSWDFGNGLKTGTSLISRSYDTEGYRPLVLMAQTDRGCKDTLIRTFRIYDNKARAGKDTVAAKRQPVQLNAQGGATTRYTWSPSIGLNNASIENPVALLDRDQLYQLDALTQEGCDSHSKIFIKRYEGPELYIPTAFTPSRNGHNDVLKVIPIGVKTFYLFAVYDRWGTLVFKATNKDNGWDGTFRGIPVDPGTFVVVAQALDYNGKPLVKKSTVMLIR